MTTGGTGATAAGALLQQLALELAFTEQSAAVTATVGELVARIDTACAAAPDALRRAVATARRWLARDAAGGMLTPATIAALGEWQPWMVGAALAWERGQPQPKLPEAWEAESARPATPAAAPLDVKVLPEGIDDEMIDIFCAESQDLLQEAERGLLALEQDPADGASIDTVFRVFHTFKGNAGMLKLVVLQGLAHELESVLDAARGGRLRLGRESIDVILAGTDVLRRSVAESLSQLAGRDRGRSIPLPVPEVIAAARALLRDGPRAEPAAGRAGAAAPPAAETVAAAPPAAAPTVAAVSAAAPSVSVAAPALASPAPAAAAPLAVGTTVGPQPGAGTVRVDTRKLDGLVDLVGELVVAQSLVTQSPELTGIGSSQLARSLAQLRGITSDLQRTAMALRMVPVGATFRRMARLVRDLSVELGKQIDLELVGEETELDRNLVEVLADPLVHMIRNSADHGIEAPAARAAAGKPAAGTITLRASHQGGCIVIRVEDDGRGLAAERILAKAVERGLVAPGVSLSREEILDLIFQPGFSTAEQVTGLSGRGVGMDVVRRGLESIRGTVEVESVEGRGTAFTLTVPLTLAIIEGLIVGVGGRRYILPTLSVRESFRPAAEAVVTVMGRGEAIEVRGRLTPLVRLGRLLDAPPPHREPGDGIVILVESGPDRRCLLVDELLGKQEVVIKSLGEMFEARTCFAGAAILGDGQVGLILDTSAIVKRKPAAGEAA
jgi:two-component system chemotaxis sensor kinase CheA